MALSEADRIGILIEYEADKNYCRETVQIAEGQKLKIGSIISQNSDGTYVGTTDTAKVVSRLGGGPGSTTGGTTGDTSGSTSESTSNFDDVLGILIEDVDTTEKEKPGVVITRDVIVNQAAIIFPSGITDTNKKSLINTFEKRGIIVRKKV